MLKNKNKWNLEFENVGVIYPNGNEALTDINFKINEGEFVGIIGLSGAGKTTLLKTINKINNISSGQIYVGDRSKEAYDKYKKYKIKYKSELEKYKNESTDSNKSKKEIKLSNIKLQKIKKEYRDNKKNKPYYMIKNLKGSAQREYKTHIGMVFQRYNLVEQSSVIKNVLSARLAQIPKYRASIGWFTKSEKEEALDALAQVNILSTAYVRTQELSGGQMQRVALARTIVQKARIILADEPVGALDPIMAKSVMDSFLKINKVSKKTILINLHHVDLALTYTDRIIGVKEGEIVYDGPSEKVDLKVLKVIYGDKLEGFDKSQLNEVARNRIKVHKEYSVKSKAK